MQGRTHLVTGVAVALAVLRPDTAPTLVAGCAAAAFGGVISDLDAGSSGVSREAVRVIAFSLIIGITLILAEMYLHIGISELLIRHGSSSPAVTPMLLFLMICAIGMLTKHRSFMHSFAAMVMLTGCVYMTAPTIALYFMTGFASHLMLDLLNRKGVRLLFPLRRGFALRWFRADGFVNNLIFSISLASIILLTAASAPVRGAAMQLRQIVAGTVYLR